MTIFAMNFKPKLMRFFLLIFLFISANAFGDNIIIHQVKSNGNDHIYKITISDTYIKIDGEVLSMKIDMDETYITFFSKAGTSVWQGVMAEYKTQYKQYAELIYFEFKNGVYKTSFEDIINKIDSSILIIKKDSFVTTTDINFSKTKIRKKSKILNYSCSTINIDDNNGNKYELLLNKTVAHNQIVDLQTAISIYNSLNTIIGTQTIQSFEYCSKNNIYEYPMQFTTLNNLHAYQESVIAIDNSELGKNACNFIKDTDNSSIQKLNLVNFITLLKDNKRRR